jgi:group I intron endonuclease
MIGIYKITSPTGRIYIGQTTNHIVRWNKYMKLQCKDQPSLYNSLLKHTPNNHTFEMIEECNVDELDNREIHWGEFYNVLSNSHLNNRLGRGFGAYDSDETKRKKSESHKGKSNYWLKDKPLSEEHKEKIRIAKIGQKYPPSDKPRRHKGRSKTDHVAGVVKAKSKPVIQYTINGEFVNEWPSGKEAARVLGFTQPNIHACCINKKKTYKGYMWVFKHIDKTL